VDGRKTDEARMGFVHELPYQSAPAAPCGHAHLETQHARQIANRLDKLAYRAKEGVLEVRLDIDLIAFRVLDLESWSKGVTTPEQGTAMSARSPL
jgi:hypothetical protein